MMTDVDPLPPDDDQLDYFVDMIKQLANRARALGDVEVAIQLDSTAEARRYALSRKHERIDGS